MLEQALIHQREVLGERLINYRTLSGNFLTELFEIQDINSAGVSDEILRQLAIIARLIDNLIDDEKVEYRDIEKQISEESQIQELRDFIFRLDKNQKEEFLSSGKIAIRCMGYYNDSQKTSSRLREGSALAHMYMKVCNTQSLRGAIFLKSFFQASYMFCDLKHMIKDERSIREIIKMFFYLAVCTSKAVYTCKNKYQTLKMIGIIVIKSVISDMKK